MKFVRVEDLRIGMRLARPIYNKQGVLLFERDSKLTSMAIISIRNFGLLGMYILEPAEPVPPLTKEDVEFERFQTMMVFQIQEELERILSTKNSYKLQTLVGNIVKNYGHLEEKINFYQNLRSREDYTAKHALNVAILCTMLCHELNVRLDEQNATIIAAIVHDIGKLSVSQEIFVGEELTEGQKLKLSNARDSAYEFFPLVFGEGTAIKRICTQSERMIEEWERGEKNLQSQKVVMGAKILMVAECFDSLTAMNLGREPMSELSAVRLLLENDDYFEQQVVRALLRVIHILKPGVSVELNSGDKALVLNENTEDFLRPMILVFRGNRVMDLSNAEYDDIWIVDIMKTMDNRHVMDVETLRQHGFKVSEPEYI